MRKNSLALVFLFLLSNMAVATSNDFRQRDCPAVPAGVEIEYIQLSNIQKYDAKKYFDEVEKMTKCRDNWNKNKDAQEAAEAIRREITDKVSKVWDNSAVNSNFGKGRKLNYLVADVIEYYSEEFKSNFERLRKERCPKECPVIDYVGSIYVNKDEQSMLYDVEHMCWHDKENERLKECSERIRQAANKIYPNVVFSKMMDKKFDEHLAEIRKIIPEQKDFHEACSSLDLEKYRVTVNNSIFKSLGKEFYNSWNSSDLEYLITGKVYKVKQNGKSIQPTVFYFDDKDLEKFRNCKLEIKSYSFGNFCVNLAPDLMYSKRPNAREDILASCAQKSAKPTSKSSPGSR